jgi:hypothetical protein
MFFSSQVPAKYKCNFQHWVNTVLTLAILYNFIIIAAFIYVYWLAASLYLDFLCIAFYLVLLFFLGAICVYALAYVPFHALYFILVHFFNINLHNLNEQDLYLQNTKVFLYTCLLLFYVVGFLLWRYKMGFLGIS